MFTTAEEVMEKTPYTDVTVDQVRHAQLIVESFVGRSENEIEDSRDKGILARATIFQTIYMRDQPDISFNQIKFGSVSRGDTAESFRDDYSPFVAPMAAMVCRNLSWLNTRSIQMGKTFQRGGGSYKDWWIRT